MKASAPPLTLARPRAAHPLAPVAVFALVLAAPLLGAGDFVLRFLAEILIFGIAVMSLDLLVGFGGLVSLGHAALFGSAAYAAALVAQRLGGDVFLALVVGVATGAALAALMALLVVRTANLFLLILTLVAGQLVWEVVFHARDLTGGADGLRGLPPLTLPLPSGPVALSDGRGLYAVTAIVALVAYALARAFVRAPLGRALVGSREQPLRMAALGYGIPKIRFAALVVSGMLAGAAGALYPFVNLYIGPSAVHWSTSATMVIMLVIGGVATLHGAFLGAAVYLGIQNYLSSYTDRWQLLVGLVFVLTVLVMPTGIASAGGRFLGKFRSGRDA